MVEDNGDFTNYEYEGKFESPPSKKGEVKETGRRKAISMRLLNILRDINLKYRINKKSLSWEFYGPCDEDTKYIYLKWYFFTFCYAKPQSKIKEGITGVILYIKSNTPSFRNHVVTAHKRILSICFIHVCSAEDCGW